MKIEQMTVHSIFMNQVRGSPSTVNYIKEHRFTNADDGDVFELYGEAQTNDGLPLERYEIVKRVVRIDRNATKKRRIPSSSNASNSGASASNSNTVTEAQPNRFGGRRRKPTKKSRKSRK